jgi:hypothetical protein
MLQFYRTLHMFNIHKSQWWFKPPGIWHYHWVSGPDVTKDHGASLLGSNSPRHDILFWVPDLVDECTVILLNIGNFSPNNTVSQLRKPQFSAKNSLKSHKLSQCSCLAVIIYITYINFNLTSNFTLFCMLVFLSMTILLWITLCVALYLLLYSI